mgnify:CR=1 FL=1
MVPIAIGAFILKARGHQRLVFLLLWFATSFIALSLISSKQAHYATLLLPSSALILGWFSYAGLSRARSWMRSLVISYWIFLLIVVWLGSLYLVYLSIAQEQTDANRNEFFIMGILLFLGSLMGLITRKPLYRLLCILTMIVAACSFYSFTAHFLMDRDHAIPHLVHTTKNQWEKAPAIYVTGANITCFEFYITKQIFYSPSLMDAWQQAPEGAIIFASSKKKKPLDTSSIAASPQADVQYNGVRAVMYEKNGESSP